MTRTACEVLRLLVELSPGALGTEEGELALDVEVCAPAGGLLAAGGAPALDAAQDSLEAVAALHGAQRTRWRLSKRTASWGAQ